MSVIITTAVDIRNIDILLLCIINFKLIDGGEPWIKGQDSRGNRMTTLFGVSSFLVYISMACTLDRSWTETVVP